MASAARPPATLTALAAVLRRPRPRAGDVARLVDALAAEPDAAALADAGAVELVVGALLAFPRVSAVTRPAINALRKLTMARPVAAAALPAPLAARFAATLAATIGDLGGHVGSFPLCISAIAGELPSSSRPASRPCCST
jgi:hypothetical protein